MNRYETHGGSVIRAAKVTDEGQVVLDTEDGQEEISLWSGSIVGGMSTVSFQDIPEMFNAPLNTWFELRRG